jgi:Undecaprenyl-phosphate glucose phosphotransferase
MMPVRQCLCITGNDNNNRAVENKKMRHEKFDQLKRRVKSIDASKLEELGNSKTDKQALRESVLEGLAETKLVSAGVATLAARAAEYVVFVVVGLVLAAIYPAYSGGTPVLSYFILAAGAAAAFVFALEVSGQYKLFRLLNPEHALSSLAAAWAGTFALTAVFVFLTKVGEIYSRIWIINWFIAGFFFMLATRFFIASVIRRLNKEKQFNRRALLVGGGADAEDVISMLDASPDAGVTVVGLFDDRDDDRSPDYSRNVAKLGGIDEIVDFVRQAKVDTIIFTLPVTAEERLLQILNKLWVLPVDIRLSAHAQKVRYRPHAYSYLGNLPCLDVYDRPLGEWGWFVKAIEDRFFAVIALILLSPVMLATALAVKFSSKGPVIFKQKRYGFNNELIEVYKFRSMYTEMTDARADRLVTKDDPRVTRVGRIIRKSSLDELPQLFNVLKGDLSLVGPRPHATAAKAAGSLYEQVVEGYFARHKVKPGITGWAQVKGWRGETDTEDKIKRRVEHDLHYIENWSLTLDLYILAITPFSLLKTENAY